jgi:hypothetical protein
MKIFKRYKHKAIDRAGILPFRMVAMNPRLVLLLCALLCAVQAHAKINPRGACGSNDVIFEVETEQSKTAPAPPAAGKAQIVLIENENQMVGTFMWATVRFGVDGAWVGANYKNSYFIVTVNPGAHRLCARWQASGPYKKAVDVASFTAEAGKVYYFAAYVRSKETGDDAENSAGRNIVFGLSQLTEDEGRNRVKARLLATSRPIK